MDFPSANALAASSNEMPWFARLAFALFRSHSNFTRSVYVSGGEASRDQRSVETPRRAKRAEGGQGSVKAISRPCLVSLSEDRLEVSGERALQDGLAKAYRALKIRSDGGLQFIDHTESALDLGDDAVLFGEGRNGNCCHSQLLETQVRPPLAVDIATPLFLTVFR